MARNVVQINFKDDDELNVLADYLRSGSVTLQSIEALKGYYHSLSVAQSSESSREDRDKSLFKSLGLLKQHMCYLMDYHFRLDGTVVTPESFSSVVINPLFKEYGDSMWASTRSGKSVLPMCDDIPDLPGVRDLTKEPVVQSPETVGQRLSRENQERSEEIDREIAARSIDPVPLVVPDDDEPEEDDYDPDYDPEDDLSEEEYLELVNSRMTVNIPVIVD